MNAEYAITAGHRVHLFYDGFTESYRVELHSSGILNLTSYYAVSESERGQKIRLAHHKTFAAIVRGLVAARRTPPPCSHQFHVAGPRPAHGHH